ncbi:response regulator [Paenibacillus lautus]
MEDQPDLVLLDINMPEPDGLELCRKIRDFYFSLKMTDRNKYS